MSDQNIIQIRIIFNGKPYGILVTPEMRSVDVAAAIHQQLDFFREAAGEPVPNFTPVRVVE